MATDMTVSNTILSHLGGNKFIAMVGATNLLGGGNRLTFKLGRMSGLKITHVMVTLNYADLYDVEFVSCRATVIKTLSKVSGVDAASLRGTVAGATGLALTL